MKFAKRLEYALANWANAPGQDLVFKLAGVHVDTRVYLPARPSFVTMAGFGGVPFRRICNSYKVKQLNFAGNCLVCVIAYEEISDQDWDRTQRPRQMTIFPMQLRLFRSGRWCVGDEKINQALADWESRVVRPFYQDILQARERARMGKALMEESIRLRRSAKKEKQKLQTTGGRNADRGKDEVRAVG